MNQSTVTEPSAAEWASMQTQFDELISEMSKADVRIAEHQAVTAKLREETRAILASLKAN